LTPRISDKYGRKLVFSVSLFCQAFIYYGIIASTNIDLTIALFFLFGVCNFGRSNVCYIYLLELIPEKSKTLIGTLLLCVDGFTLILSSFYF
jgi:MFS family permease